MKAGNIVIPVVPLKYLIEMKEKTGRPQDKADAYYQKSKTGGSMKTEPLLYYKTKKEIEAYRQKPVKEKLRWLEAQMEFFHKAMPEKAKRIRDELKEGRL